MKALLRFLAGFGARRRARRPVPHAEGLRRLQELQAAVSCYRPEEECPLDVYELKSARRVVPRAPSIECPRCHAISFNPTDIAERYCGRCHAYHDAL